MKVFLEENKKLNLSAYREEGQCWVGNVLDSVIALDELWDIFCAGYEVERGKWKGEKEKISIIDVGMGGGFPMLPLAIMLPDVKFTGLDATGKKVEAVKRICKKMRINNVDFITGRAEEVGHDNKYREKFDVVMARAVAPLSTLLEYMSPFASVKGRMLCWKSMNIADELTDSINARIKLNAQLVNKVIYSLEQVTSCEGWGRRQILVFEKTGKLSGEFPRGWGLRRRIRFNCMKQPPSF